MKRIKTLTALAATLCCLASTSQATLLIPGAPSLPAVGLATPPGGAPMLIDPFGPTPVDGSVFSWVGIDALNPIIGGGLTFYYQVNNLPPGASAFNRFTATGFAGIVVDATFIPGGVAPATADKSALIGDGGDTVGFNFPLPLGTIPNGASSAILVVHTSYFGPVGIREGGVIDGAGRLVEVLAPVPEPTTMIAGALLLLPFAASTVRKLRKA